MWKWNCHNVQLDYLIDVNCGPQCDQIWRNFTTSVNLSGLFSIWQKFNLHWQILCAVGQISIVLTGQILKISEVSDHTEFVSPELNVTRLGEISPLWPTFKSIWLFLEGLHFFPKCSSYIGKILCCFWANFHCWSCQI